MADIVRAFIQKGMSVDAYTEEIDFITTIIRQEITIAINGLSNRLAGLASKDLIMSAASYYSTIAIIADLIDVNRYTTFREIEKKARQLAVEYMKMKLTDVEKLFLSGDGFEQDAERLRGGDADFIAMRDQAKSGVSEITDQLVSEFENYLKQLNPKAFRAFQQRQRAKYQAEAEKRIANRILSTVRTIIQLEKDASFNIKQANWQYAMTEQLVLELLNMMEGLAMNAQMDYDDKSKLMGANAEAALTHQIPLIVGKIWEIESTYRNAAQLGISSLNSYRSMLEYNHHVNEAMENFAVRSGLVDGKKLFSENELILIHDEMVKFLISPNDKTMDQFEQVQILIDRLEELLPELKDREILLNYEQEFSHDFDGNSETLEITEEGR
ncbi:hypothetical protein G195_008683 [Phytophthora kernoviae 00238/432]|uniref:Uncharacterized protein n=1 Tax=Phytophthora kernoviae 00238/432 TaxID=1284355 RepID=A0A8J4S829_9STRA|nr:hypothetical protein G195_008683 [Phytophthora kernoviae 00238/432]